ncbi:MAG: peptidoglycan-binding protein [Candidatus Gracilibacteria bacterium]
MKNIIITLIFAQLFTIISPVFAEEKTSSSNQKFIVTAYYSPLPDQSFYLKGSYKADILLNGNGTHGASGKEVYPGMLAGPKTYAFGTQVYLEGLGIGTIDDRGGAIVSSGSRGYDADRLDIWMGQGEEGLKRALSWGKRTVFGKVIDTQTGASIDLSQVKIEKIDTMKYEKQQVQKVLVPERPSVFTSAIGRNTDTETIKELQIAFTNLAYYKGEIDGKYSSLLVDAIYDFQVENQLVQSIQDSGAGYFGTKTRTKLQEIYTLYQENEKKQIAEKARIALIKAEKDKQEAVQKKEVTLFVQSFGYPHMNEIGAHVRNLQQGLRSLGYFNQKDTAIFGKVTKAALISYQTDKNIPSEESGILGKVTKETLIKDLFTLKGDKGNTLAYNTK